MIKILLPVLVIICALTTACSKNSQATSNMLNIRKGSCLQATVTDAKLRICYEALIEDSRCPPTFQCIWAGRAVVRLSVFLGTEKYTILLATNRFGNGPSADTVVNGITIHLQDVVPYANESRGITPYINVSLSR